MPKALSVSFAERVQPGPAKPLTRGIALSASPSATYSDFVFPATRARFGIKRRRKQTNFYLFISFAFHRFFFVQHLASATDSELRHDVQFYRRCSRGTCLLQIVAAMTSAKSSLENKMQFYIPRHVSDCFGCCCTMLFVVETIII